MSQLSHFRRGSCALLGLVAGGLWEPVDASAQASAEDSTCRPACEAGQTCHAGACVARCNPPCAAGYRCAEGSQCIPDTSPEPEQLTASEDEGANTDPTAYRHDGFYLSFGYTLGYAFDHATRDSGSSESRGVGGLYEFAIGGTPMEGVVFAFVQHTLPIFAPSTSVDGERLTAEHQLLYQVLGTALIYYPDDSSGLNFSLTFGVGTASMQFEDTSDRPMTDDDGSDTFGFGASLGVGHGIWLGEQWSLNAGVRVLYIDASEAILGVHRVVAPLAVVGFAYH